MGISYAGRFQGILSTLEDTKRQCMTLGEVDGGQDKFCGNALAILG